MIKWLQLVVSAFAIGIIIGCAQEVMAERERAQKLVDQLIFVGRYDICFAVQGDRVVGVVPATQCIIGVSGPRP